MKTVLVTGGTGFLGSCVVGSLLGRYRVVVAKRSSSDCFRLEPFRTELEFVDVDTLSLREVFSRYSISAVVHTAVEYGKGVVDAGRVRATNVEFPMKLCEEALRAGVSLILNTDSYFVRLSEENTYLLPYRRTKQEFRDWLKGLSASAAIVNVQLEHIYGGGDRMDKFVPSVTRRIVSGESPIELTGGLQRRDFVHVRDAAEAYRAVLDHSATLEKGFRQVEVGTGTSLSVRDFVTQIRTQAKSEVELRFGALPYRHAELMDSRADTLWRKGIPWHPRISLEQGIDELLSNFGVGVQIPVRTPLSRSREFLQNEPFRD